MERNRIKIFRLRNWLLLTIISYALYSLLWLLIDRNVFVYTGSVSEVIIDFLICAFFSFLSLGISHFIFSILRFHTGFKWSLIYGSVLLLVNNLIAILMNHAFEWMYGETQDPLFRVQGIYTFAMVSTLISSIYILTAFMNNYNKAIEDKLATELLLMKEKESALEARFNALKMQINPHFLFNNFSTLSELIETEPETAQSFLSHLSKVYRHIVRNLNVSLIDIKDELKFLDSYAYLMDLRHGKGVKIVVDEKLRNHKGKIPPASLQLLVENAIKHNSLSAENPLTIDITLENEHLVVRNRKHPLSSVAESTGIGQANIIRRYSMLSNEDVIIEDSLNYYTVILPLL